MNIMTTQPKSKLLLIIIGILLVTNIVLITFLTTNKQGPKKGMRGDRSAAIATFLKNEVGFTPQQLQQYDTLNAQHHAKTKAIFDALRIDKNNELKQLGANHFSDSAITYTIGHAAAKQQEIDRLMLQHFKAIRDICTPQQLPIFDSSFYKVLSRKMMK